jgi:transcriptional antiterminator NusG
MTNTYAINTTRNQEFGVAEDLAAMGLSAWVPRQLSSRYVKEKRETVWYDRPYVPKLLFCVIPAIYWRDVVEMKHVIGKPVRLSRMDLEGVPAHTGPNGKPVAARPGLVSFKAAVESEYEDRARHRANSEYQCQYKPGQALEILDGAFAGFPAEFKKVVKHAHDEYSKILVGVQIFGRETPAEIDPDKVKGVA